MENRGETRDGEFARATPRLCRMMARLEEAEHADNAAARLWLDRAERALPDPRYICANCGGDSLEWHSLCPRCGAFDALAWRTPAWAGPPLPVESRLGTEPIAAGAAEPLTANVGSG